MRGDSEPNGILKDDLHAPAQRPHLAEGIAVNFFWPSRRYGPSTMSLRDSARPSVVLPEPDSPTTPSVCPALTQLDDRCHRPPSHGPRRGAEEARLDREPDLDVIARDDRLGVHRLGGGALRLGGEQVAGIGVLRVGKYLAGTGPVSTILPLVITQTRSAMRRTMPRSWVMNSIDMPFSSLSSSSKRQDLRLHRHVERGGRLVGDQQFRLGWRAPWRS
jgi:hypothetical protein